MPLPTRVSNYYHLQSSPHNTLGYVFHSVDVDLEQLVTVKRFEHETKGTISDTAGVIKLHRQCCEISCLILNNQLETCKCLLDTLNLNNGLHKVVLYFFFQ